MFTYQQNYQDLIYILQETYRCSRQKLSGVRPHTVTMTLKFEEVVIKTNAYYLECN